MNLLIISHGHPELSAGGAERAAYSLFQQMKNVAGVSVSFIARAEPKYIGHDGWFGSFRGRHDEFLWAPPAFDWFRCTSQQPDLLKEQIDVIADRFKPDFTHLHHYFFFGADAIQMFKQCTGKGVAVTFHEYGLICSHNGQMIKKSSMRLCQAASSAECAICFPEYTSGKFFLREKLSKQLLEYADAFVSPSFFLKGRYVEWGLDEGKFAVIENLLPSWFEDLSSVPPKEARRGKTRLGYFGQINPYKGANVLLDALQHLSEKSKKKIELVIFGANLEGQTAEFQAALQRQLKNSEGLVSFFGPYRNEDVPALMRGVDWMVIPSIWWENSPVVIQEAKATATPILASNIGGMAEKVRPNLDGIHFLAGSAMDCASKIEMILAGDIKLSPDALDVRAQNADCTRKHIDLYRNASLKPKH
jgi:glycosyltransferase involved in cell wall biosynthesis